MMRKVKNQLRKGLELRKRNLSSLFPIYQGPKITGIAVYSVSLPLHEGSYKWSGGNEIVAFDSTVVRIVTDKGIEGFGENTPLGSAYLPAYAEGTRTGIRQIAPSLLGMDPTRIHDIYLTMDKCLKGHPYVKSALDMACWDITGKVAGLLLSASCSEGDSELSFLYIELSLKTHQKIWLREYKSMSMRVIGKPSTNTSEVSQCIRKFQLKVGGSPQVDIERIRAVRRILDDKV
jgi:L-alanine-DL-glutamate epimerase-like enolase superfamily enzyme